MPLYSMSNSSVFLFFNEYPVIPVEVFAVNLLSFIPMICLLYISQVAPLHSNCRYILCVWSIGFGVVFALTCALEVIDFVNETGYMPLNIFEPKIRFVLYQWHVRCTVFCSTLEILLSLERILAIVRPRRYHFSALTLKTLVSITLVLMIVAYAVDAWVHSEDKFVPGLIIYAIIEVGVLAVGNLAMHACRIRYARSYGKSSLTVRYQVSMIALVCLYFSNMKQYGYMLGYLHAFYFTIIASNGSFSMTILLRTHPQLRRHTIRKFRQIFGTRTEEKVRSKSVVDDTEVHFSIVSLHWN